MSTTHVRLHRDRWTKISLPNRVIWFQGFIEADGQYYNQKNITEYFQTKRDRNDFTTVSGNFAIIIEQEEETAIFADRVRSIPLFYYQDEDGNWIITDQLNKDMIEGKWDDLAVYEFLLTGYVSGKNTLYPHIYQLEAGQYVVFSRDGVKQVEYFQYYHQPEEQMDLDSAVEELKKVFYDVFGRLAKRLKGQQVMIPLSGGYDSRIVALLLKEVGIDSLSSFTYGNAQNSEAKKSKEIAERLGIPWTIYPYTKEQWKQWYHSESWRHYVSIAANCSSIPHLQDWPAVQAITQEMDHSFVFVPGHTGDFLGGSHLSPHFLVKSSFSLDEVVEQIMNKHHRLWEARQKEVYEQVKNKIKNSLHGFAYEHPEEASALFEYWDWKERQAKFIVNSLRVYEFFGHRWEIPLWDHKLIDFFLKVPLRYRYNKYLYDITLHRMYPDYFPEPIFVQKMELPVWKKGMIYKFIRLGYRYKLTLQQYDRHPMEWFGITGSYLDYLKQLSIQYKGKTFKFPYNVNSFVAKDYLFHF